MKIARATPEKDKPYSTVVEVFQPDFCDRLGWTKENNIDSTHETILVLSDADPVEVGWRIYDGIVSDPRNPILPDATERKKEEIATARYDAEVGGMDFYGIRIATDDRSKSLISAAHDKAQKNPAFMTRWKTSDGTFRPVDAATIIAIYDMLSVHVDAGFRKEAAILDILSDCKSVEEVSAISWDMDETPYLAIEE